MEPIPQPSSVVPDVVPPPAPAAPAAPPPPMPAAVPAAPAGPAAASYSSGGILSGVTLTGVGMIILTSLVYFYGIYYYRQAVANLKNRKQDRNDIDEVKANLQRLLGQQYQNV